MTSVEAKIAEQVPGVDGEQGTSQPKRKRKKLFLAAAVLAVVLAGVGVAWATGALRGLTGGTDSAPASKEAGAIDLPDIIANLNTGSRRSSFVRLKSRLDLTSKADEAEATTKIPRLLDLFQTYLRDMRPEELRGSAGTYRLREELLARANIILDPAKATDILFIEMLVQ